MKQIVLEIEHLNCPNCAKKIEENIAKLDFVENVTLSFPTKKFILKLIKVVNKFYQLSLKR